MGIVMTVIVRGPWHRDGLVQRMKDRRRATHVQSLRAQESTVSVVGIDCGRIADWKGFGLPEFRQSRAVPWQKGLNRERARPSERLGDQRA